MTKSGLSNHGMPLGPEGSAGDVPREIWRDERTRNLVSLLAQTPIIPAVRIPERLAAAASAPGKIVYFLFGDPDNIEDMTRVIIEHGKLPIQNLDLMSGMARDQSAVSFLAHRGVQGIISTHPEPLRAARRMGLFAIQRTFLIDSGAVESSLRNLGQFSPDALEVLPAIAAPKLLPRLRSAHATLPVIAGGLITSMQEAEHCFQNGVSAISVSDDKLWLV